MVKDVLGMVVLECYGFNFYEFISFYVVVIVFMILFLFGLILLMVVVMIILVVIWIWVIVVVVLIVLCIIGYVVVVLGDVECGKLVVCNVVVGLLMMVVIFVIG